MTVRVASRYPEIRLFSKTIRLLSSNLMSADSSSGRIVRWEILKGLPGEGLIPKYFHMGHPTPWAEGFVVRFWNEAMQTSWIVRLRNEHQSGWP
jgi:hypothetical protein